MKIYLIAFILINTILKAQVAIGKTDITSPEISLEFGYSDTDVMMKKGLMLPWVTSASDLKNVVPGTLIYDLKDYKIKFKKNSTTNPWGDLTYTTTGAADTTDYLKINENTKARVIIKSQLNFADGISEDEKKRLTEEDIQSQPEGILVLGDTDKAMLMPSVSNYKDLPNPSPGTIVFDLSNKLFCTFNGTEWTFCKAQD